VAQLRDNYIDSPTSPRLSPDHRQYTEIMARHAAAVLAGDPCYPDPATGLSVFTAQFLADRGYCCESGCRHCPFVAG
jgi:hypothetical protein